MVVGQIHQVNFTKKLEKKHSGYYSPWPLAYRSNLSVKCDSKLIHIP